MDLLFKKILDTLSLIGSEEKLTNLIEEKITNNNCEKYIDKIGNLVVKCGQGKEKIMVCTHLDQISFIVTYIEDTGIIRVDNIGNIKNEDIQNSIVEFNNGIRGKLINNNNELFVEIGVNSKDQVIANGITEGYICGLVGNIMEYNHNIMSCNISDKIGSYILLEIINTLDIEDKEVYFVFSTHGQLDGRGARAAAYSINPDSCIIIGTALASDNIIYNGKIYLEKGPIIKIMGKSLIGNIQLINLIDSICKENKINLQRLVDNETSLGGFIHKEKSGIPTVEIGIPCKYKKSNNEMVNNSDIMELIKLVRLILKK